MNSEDAQQIIRERIRVAGFRLLRFEPPGDDFPPATVAAYVTGPGMPAHGVGFCVPEKNKERWAQRYMMALAIAWEAGASRSAINAARNG